MAEFYTLTLNPALDRTIYTENFRAGGTNRAKKTVVSCGGKGINVSRALLKMGINAPAYAFYGGDEGETLRRRLAAEGVECRFTRCGAPTRVNVKIIDSAGVCTELNEPGGPVAAEEMSALASKIAREIGNSTANHPVFDIFLIMGGSIPQGVEKAVYKSMTEALKDAGVRPVVDTSGEALSEALKASPYLIKPNLSELSGICGHSISTLSSAVEEVSRIFVETGTRVVCTAAENGSLYAGPEGIYTASSPQVTLRGFVGAGDAYLAAFLASLCAGKDVPSAMAFAASAAAAKVELPGTEFPAAGALAKYGKTVNIKKLG